MGRGGASDRQRNRRERATVALRHRDFRLLWAGDLVSTLGTQMQTVALGWQLYQLTGDPLRLGLLGLLRAVPTVVFSLFGGALADSRDRRRLLLLTQCCWRASPACWRWRPGPATRRRR